MDDGQKRIDWRPWAALAVVLSIYIFTQVIPTLRHSNQNDFKHIYIGALLLSEGQDPYDARLVQETAGILTSEDARFRTILPYVYLPFTGIVLWPLSKLTFANAAVTWEMINHLLLAAGLFLAAAAAGWKWTWQSVALLGLAVVLNWTIFRQNSAGQLNMVLFFGMALLFFGLVRGWHPAATGGIAAFLMLFKITPGIFLIWFLLSRRRREAAFMVAWAIALTILTVLVAGLKVHLNFLPILADMGFGKSTWSEFGQTFWRDPFNQSLNAFFHHIFASWDGSPVWVNAGPRIANAATWIVALCLLGVFAWRTWIASDRQDSSVDPASFGLAVLTGLLAPSILWDHYLVQALIPAILLWNSNGKIPVKWARIAVIAVVTIYCFNYNFGSGGLGSFLLGLQKPIITLNPWGGAGYLLMSLKLWPTLVLFALCAIQIQPACGNRESASKIDKDVTGNP
ncbi:DUF2029 domain-containing protein [bacterium]|nr:DUF2029 domain-containing protein [bacterium]